MYIIPNMCSICINWKTAVFYSQKCKCSFFMIADSNLVLNWRGSWALALIEFLPSLNYSVYCWNLYSLILLYTTGTLAVDGSGGQGMGERGQSKWNKCIWKRILKIDLVFTFPFLNFKLYKGSCPFPRYPKRNIFETISIDTEKLFIFLALFFFPID